MAKPEWGKKRTCQSCAAKYYDLQKDPAICPKCGTVFQAETPQRGRRGRAAEAPKAIPAAAAIIPTSEDDIDGLDDDVLDDDDDESLPEDTSDLGDDDDVGVVIDVSDKDLDDT